MTDRSFHGKQLAYQHPTFARRRFSGHVSSRLRDVALGLLQRHSRRGVAPMQLHHRQASASTECRCLSRQRQPQVRPRPITSTTRAAAPARCSSRRIQFKLYATAHCCLQARAPQYLPECCIPISDITCRQHLWSANCHHLFVVSYLATRVRCPVVSPSLWLASWPGTCYLTLFVIRHVRVSCGDAA